MSTPLPPKFFVNPHCPPGAVPVEAAIAREASIREEVERFSAVGAKVGNDLDSLSKVAGEREDPSASGES